MDTKTFGNWLKNERLARKMTTTKLSEEVGMSRVFMSELQHGHKEPSLSTVIKISNSLDIPLYDVLEQLGYKQFSDKELQKENEYLRNKIDELKKLVNSI